FFANYKIFEASLWVSVFDSLVFNMSYSLLGLAHWYSVKFNQMERHNTATLIFQHLAVSAISLLLLMVVGYYSIKLVPVLQTEFLLLYNNSLVLKLIYGFWYYAMLTMVHYVIIYYSNFKEKLV